MADYLKKELLDIRDGILKLNSVANARRRRTLSDGIIGALGTPKEGAASEEADFRVEAGDKSPPMQLKKWYLRIKN